MNRKENINKLIEEALGSVDAVTRATPKPYLLTRINAQMNKATESAWEKAGWFIGRPAVAFVGLCLVVLINVAVIMLNKNADANTTAEQTVQTQADEFSYTVATIYDIDNTQP